MITPRLHRRGGTERSVWEHVARWREDFDLRVYTTSSATDAPEGVTVRRVPAAPAPHLLHWASWVVGNHARRRWDSLVGLGPDVVVSPGVNALDADVDGVHLLFARLAGSADSMAPAADRFRSLHRRAYFALVSALERRVYGGPALVYAVSARDAAEIERRFERPAGSVPVVPHGVDAEAFSPERVAALREVARAAHGLDGRRVVLLVGNEPTVKGVDLAIDALAKMPDDVVLALAGRFDHAQIGHWIEAAGVADRVVLLGHSADPVRLYALADVAIAPSRQDSFNLPALEALACGLGLVLSDATGLAEHVDGCADVTVLPSPVDPGSLADAVVTMLERTTADGSGRALARSLDWGSSAARAADLIRREATTPRVLVLATDAGRTGGIQRVTRTLARAAADVYGAERVGVLSVWRGDHQVPGRELRRGDEHRNDVRVGPVRAAAFAIDAVATARRWRRRLAIVVTHPHLAPVGWLARLASGAPYAVWCHGIEVWGPLDRVTRSALRRADRVFAPSRFTAVQVEQRAGLRAGSVVVVPHCVPPELADERATDATDETAASVRASGSVLTVARLHPDHAYKGVDTLIEAWPTVMVSLPDATLKVAGEGPDRERLQRRARDLGVSDSIVFAGRLSDRELADAYATSSLFAMPARHRTGPGAQGEGFGLVFVEAGAAGLPVVAGAGAGADDAVDHDVSGLLVDPLDAGAVAEALVRVLVDPELAARLGTGGRRLASTRYSYETFRASVIELLDSMPIEGLVR